MYKVRFLKIFLTFKSFIISFKNKFQDFFKLKQ
jgi:hypothetical protein